MKKLLPFLLLAAISCNSTDTKTTDMDTTDITKNVLAGFEKQDPLFDTLLPDVHIEVIADSMEWSEGPLWLPTENALIFSDVPRNTIYKWTEEGGTVEYLKPSGYTGTEPSKSKESGSNGLTLSPDGKLVLCQHGNRQMASMDAPLNAPVAKYTSLANNYQGKKFSSPNDAVYNSAGELYFTDPPYGLPSQDDTDPGKEIKFNGVYKVKKDGTVVLQVDSITRPNGIAFFPGEKQILVASSDPKAPNWYIYNVEGDKLTNGRIFYSAAGYDKSWHGLPDGLKIMKNGTVIASGPGGVYVLSKEGKLLGMIRLKEACSNIALSPDEKTIFVTNDMYVLKIQVKH
jgi:gluconolactonase